MKKLLTLILLFPICVAAQTRNIVPRTTDAGNIGLSTLTWHGVYGTQFYGGGSNLTGLIQSTATGSYPLSITGTVPATGVSAGSLGSSVIASSITLGSMWGAPTLTGTNITAIPNSALVTPVIPSSATGTYPLSISGTATEATHATTASNVTTNANLTGPITSVGNATTIVGPIPVSTIDLSTVTTAIGLRVLKAGDTMTGPLTLSGSTLTVTGSAFSVGGSTLVVVNGMVGIGGVPNSPLDIISSALDVDILRAISNGHTAGLQVDGAGNWGVSFSLDGGSMLTANSDGGIAIGGAYQNSATPTDGLIVVGNVGIGTAAPSTKLHVAGDMMATGAATFTSSLTVTGATGEFGVKVSSNLYVVGYSSATAYYGDGSNLTGVSSLSSSSSTLLNTFLTSSTTYVSVDGSTLTVTTTGGTRFMVGFSGSVSASLPGSYCFLSYRIDGITQSFSLAVQDVAGGSDITGSFTVLSPSVSAGVHSIHLVIKADSGTSGILNNGDGDGVPEFWIKEIN